MGPAFEIQIHPVRRGLLARKQWAARTVSTGNWKQITKTTESYNNRSDLERIMRKLHPYLPITYASR
jgi:hypothetical protein